jgi:DNA polymerase-3 subunit gamma/tau
MRDAESMLDQLLGTDTGALTADHVRDVLGLVEEETVEAFLDALVRGEAVAGIELLDGLEERGRDLRAFTEQAIEGLRLALLSSLGHGTPSGLASAGSGALSAVARRLASLDMAHPGAGGLRLQLELALLAPVGAASGVAPASAPVERAAVRAPAPAPPERAASTRSPAPTRSASPTPPASPTRSASPTPPASAARSASALHSAPSEPSTPTVPGTSSGPTLALLLERWAEIVEVISKSPPTRPLIVACRPVGVDGNVVTLGFPENQTFFKDVADRRRPILEDGVSRVLGMPVSVRCVAANVEVAPLPEDPDSARLLTEFKRIYGDDAVDVGDVG